MKSNKKTWLYIFLSLNLLFYIGFIIAQKLAAYPDSTVNVLKADSPKNSLPLNYGDKIDDLFLTDIANKKISITENNRFKVLKIVLTSQGDINLDALIPFVEMAEQFNRDVVDFALLYAGDLHEDKLNELIKIQNTYQIHICKISKEDIVNKIGLSASKIHGYRIVLAQNNEIRFAHFAFPEAMIKEIVLNEISKDKVKKGES